MAYGQQLTSQFTIGFHTFPAISEEVFFRTCDTGDILLYRSNCTVSWAQRSLLSSQFDHIGVILRFGRRPTDVYILEAVDGGVRMTSWEQARWYIGPCFDAIGYRKLHITLSDEQLENFDAFRRKAL